uniref:Uncharacterized protein n=1 Tax=Knipowitschia caucasica TaxID=637954 RepID=A0AAV2M5R2_KNICA
MVVVEETMECAQFTVRDADLGLGCISLMQSWEQRGTSSQTGGYLLPTARPATWFDPVGFGNAPAACCTYSAVSHFELAQGSFQTDICCL